MNNPACHHVFDYLMNSKCNVLHRLVTCKATALQNISGGLSE